MESWKVVKYGEGFAVQTPDPDPDTTDIYNAPSEIIVRQDKAGIYGSELTEKDARLIAAAPKMKDALNNAANIISLALKNGAWKSDPKDLDSEDSMEEVESVLDEIRKAISDAERKENKQREL